MPRNPSFTWELGKSAFLGGRYESFKAGDPNQANYKVQDLTAGERSTHKKAARRDTLLKAVDGLAKRVEGNDQIATYDEFHARAREMVLSTEARNAFAIDRRIRRSSATGTAATPPASRCCWPAGWSRKPACGS